MNQKGKVTTSVVASGIVGAIAAPGAVFCAERCLPSQMNWLKHLVADHIVEPHLALFEKLSAKLTRASDIRCLNDPENCPPDPALQGQDPKSPGGRSLTIADGLVTSMLAWSVDFAATYGSQVALNKQLGVYTSPLKTTFIDSGVALGAMALMPTLAAKPSEALNHTLSHILHKTTGISKNHAKDFTGPLVYAGLPNLLGAYAALKSQTMTRSR